jgi:hypothetical protein
MLVVILSRRRTMSATSTEEKNKGSHAEDEEMQPL